MRVQGLGFMRFGVIRFGVYQVWGLGFWAFRVQGRLGPGAFQP